MNYKHLLKSRQRRPESKGRAAKPLLPTAYCLLLTAFCLLLSAVTALGQEATAKGQSPSGEIERITVDELKAMLANHQPVTIIDARSPNSYDATETKIKGAIRMTADDIALRWKEIPRDKEIVIYCT